MNILFLADCLNSFECAPGRSWSVNICIHYRPRASISDASKILALVCVNLDDRVLLDKDRNVHHLKEQKKNERV